MTGLLLVLALSNSWDPSNGNHGVYSGNEIKGEIWSDTFHTSTDSICVTLKHPGTNTIGCLQDGKVTKTVQMRWIGLSNKDMNRQVKTRNGNCTKNVLKIIHWNAGAKLWLNKRTELEALLLEISPDICFISEANLWSNISMEEGAITGYNLVLPNTMGLLNHARLIALTKEDLNITVDTASMDKEIAEIWLKIGDSKNNSLLIGGCYRQHHILGRDYGNSSRLDIQWEQEVRWERFLRKWKNKSRNKKCIVLGDFNLDHLRWETPEPHLDRMVEDTKNLIENSGFTQLITTFTRSWRAQANSLLDHIWTNCPQRTIKTINLERGASDHNVVGVEVSTRDIVIGGQNILRRSWKTFDRQRCFDKFRLTDWTSILNQTDARLAASQLEELISN